MMDILNSIFEFVVSSKPIVFILALDGIRACIAYLGIIDRDLPVIGRIIYGKYDASVIKTALKELGYSKEEAVKLSQKLKKENNSVNNVPRHDTARHLIYLLSKYTYEFEDTISYGLIAPQRERSYSNYYISTMDAVHNATDLEKLSVIMIRLIYSVMKNQSIDFIIVPKGGNPLLAQHVAQKLNILLIIAKDRNDSARPPQDKKDSKLFAIRYEGLNELIKKNRDKGKKCRGIVLDCNTSGATQLTNIVKEFNQFVDVCDYPIEHLTYAFVLFKLVKINKSTGQEIDIEKAFSDIDCKLNRFFDLDEEDKAKLVDISGLDYYENLDRIDQIIDGIKNKGRYYYKED